MSKSKITASIITIGNQAVGKTAISKRFSNDDFDELYSATVGIDFFSKTVQRNGEEINVKIWDSTGQERFMTITKQYIKRAEGMLVVFDVNDRGSFEKLDTWLEQINEQARQQKIPMVIIGNKCDLDGRTVSEAEARKYAEGKGANYYDVSAKTGKGITECMDDLLDQILKSKKDCYEDDGATVIKKEDSQNKKKKKCC